MSELINEEIKKQIGQVFAAIRQPVQILFFGTQAECEYCQDIRQLLEEVVALSSELGLSVYDVVDDAAAAQQYHVDKAPMLIVAAREGDRFVDTGIRYAGLPAGHEFTTLIEAIVLVSGRDSGLKQPTRELLKNLKKPVYLQVFVTTSCPYCPQAVLLAHRMAMENPAMIRAEGVESMEFPDLADEFNVSGVPQTTINQGIGTVIGAVPEAHLLAEIQRVAG